LPARCLLPRPPNGGRRGGSATGDGARVALDRARPLGSAPRLKGDGLRVLGSGQPKASASGQRRLFPGGQKLPSSTRRKNANADRPVRFKSKFISSHGWLAQGK